MKTPFNICLSLLSASLLLWNCSSPNQQENTAEDSIAVNMENAEAMPTVAEPVDYLLQTMMNSMMYASLAQEAQEKASSQEVKDFASDLSGSSKEIAGKIQDLFKAVEGEAPQAMGVEQQAKLDSLLELPATEFDQAFVNFVVQAHQDDIKTIQSLETEADNTVVIGLADEVEKMMQAQLEKAEVVKEDLM